MRMYKQRKDQVSRRWTVRHVGLVVIVCSLALFLSACTNFFQGPSQTGNGASDVSSLPTPTATVPVIPTLPPTIITLKVTGCPATPAINWDHLLATQANVNKVQTVTCDTIENGALAALVTVRYYSADDKLDWYVYDNLPGTPARRFSMLGLMRGDVQISPTKTIMTAQRVSSDPIPPNVFKEYQWNGTGFTQIFFPGLFPDPTHYQAEKAQANVNAQAKILPTVGPGTPTPAPNSPSAFSVTNRFATTILHWINPQNHVVTFSSRTSTYVIQVLNTGLGGGGFTATLFHLDNVPTNIFEIGQLTALDTTTTITSPTNGVQVTNPVNVSGSATVSSTTLGQIYLYDDTFTIVGTSGKVQSPSPSGYVSFAQAIKYQVSGSGQQEGVVALFTTNQNNTQLVNQAALVKVIFSA